MKKLLAVSLVLGMATTAFGAGIELRIGPTDGAVDGNTVTLIPSQFVTIETWITNADVGVASGVWGFNAATNPPGVPDVTVEHIVQGPQMYGYSTNTYTGLDDLAISVYAYPYPTAAADYLLASVTLHCAGPGTVTVVSFDNLAGSAQIQKPDQSGYTLDFGLSQLTIIQIPEPASLALLALGGLALIRRR